MPYLLVVLIVFGLPLIVLFRRLRPYLWTGFYVRMQVIGLVFVVYSGLLENVLAGARRWLAEHAFFLGVWLLELPLERYLVLAAQALLAALFVLWLWRRAYPEDFGAPR